MSDPSDNVHHVRREPLEDEVAATSISPLDSGDVPITVVNRDTRRAVVMAALRRLRTRVLIPALLGAMVEWLARQVRQKPVTVAIAGTAAISTAIVGASAFALASNDQPLAAPPAVVERVTLPPLPAVTHTITTTPAMERTITLSPSTPPPAVIRLRPPARVQEPAPTSTQARPTARPSAKPRQKPPSATPRPEIRVPETPPATPRQTEAPRPQSVTQPSPRPTQKADPAPSRDPEQTQAPEQTRTPEASQTSKPTPPPEVPTTKACGVRVDLGPLLDLCVLG